MGLNRPKKCHIYTRYKGKDKGEKIDKSSIGKYCINRQSHMEAEMTEVHSGAGEARHDPIKGAMLYLLRIGCELNLSEDKTMISFQLQDEDQHWYSCTFSFNEGCELLIYQTMRIKCVIADSVEETRQAIEDHNQVAGDGYFIYVADTHMICWRCPLVLAGAGGVTLSQISFVVSCGCEAFDDLVESALHKSDPFGRLSSKSSPPRLS
jgi:hypothetical protein